MLEKKLSLLQCAAHDLDQQRAVHGKFYCIAGASVTGVLHNIKLQLHNINNKCTVKYKSSMIIIIVLILEKHHEPPFLFNDNFK